MIDFPINELLDEERCRQWLEEHFHPNGLRCPNCQSERRRNFRQLRHFQAYRCLDCTRYYTLLSGTIFEKSQQAPSTLVMLIRGIAKGESSSQMSRELNLSRKQVGTIRRVIQENLLAALPREPMIGSTFERVPLGREWALPVLTAQGFNPAALIFINPATQTILEAINSKVNLDTKRNESTP